MPEWSIEVIKYFGVSGLLFYIFYLYHQSTTKQMQEVLESYKEVMVKNFDLLNKMIDQNSLQLSYLQKIDTSVSNNLWCPFVKEKTGNKKRGNKK